MRCNISNGGKTSFVMAGSIMILSGNQFIREELPHFLKGMIWDDMGLTYKEKQNLLSKLKNNPYQKYTDHEEVCGLCRGDGYEIFTGKSLHGLEWQRCDPCRACKGSGKIMVESILKGLFRNFPVPPQHNSFAKCLQNRLDCGLWDNLNLFLYNLDTTIDKISSKPILSKFIINEDDFKTSSIYEDFQRIDNNTYKNNVGVVVYTSKIMPRGQCFCLGGQTWHKEVR